MRMNERLKKALSMVLCLCMLLQNAPVMAFAATTDNLCDHHTEHTPECGYREGGAGSACTHEHSEDCYKILNCLHECGTECEQGCTHECTVENGCVRLELDCHHVHGDCGYSEGTAEVPCGHVHNESCGYVEAVVGNPCANAETDPECDHSGDCGYVAAVEGQPCGHTACDDTCGYAPATEGTPCTHVCEVKVDSADSCYKLLCSHADGGHDDACGYAAAVEAHECHYECAECANSNVIANQSADWCGNPLCSQEDAFHVTSCPQYVAPENPQCFCAEKCTEINEWCDVCGFDISKCGGTDEGVPYADTEFQVYAVGNGSGAWLNGSIWDPGYVSNCMAETADGIYEITYTGVNAGDEYMLKFAANGSWGNQWAGTYAGSGVETDAVFEANAISFSVPEDGSSVKLRFDLSGYDHTTRTGAKFTITVMEGTSSAVQSSITIGEVENGTVTTDKATAAEGETVTLTVTPAEGYVLNALTVNDGTVEVTKVGDTTYTFPMPAGDVTVGASFKACTEHVYGDDGICTLCGRAKPDSPVLATVYFINSNEWEQVCAYVWGDDDSLTQWPGTLMTKTEQNVNGFDIYEFTCDASYVNLIFNNNNRGYQSDNLAFMDGQYYDSKSCAWYASLDEVPAVDVLATDRFLVGSFNSWNTVSHEFKLNEVGSVTGYVSLELEANTTYEFKIVREGTWTSNDSPITGTVEGLSFSSSKSNNATITTAAAGTYVFAFGLNDSKLSVTYPVVLYTVTIADGIVNGTVEADKDTAAQGDTVTLTVEPAEGYVLDTLSVKQGETDVTVTDNTFPMPAGDVTVSATFVACTHETYEDGKCTACGYECPHEAYTDGKCALCGYECPHEVYDNGFCTVCDAYQIAAMNGRYYEIYNAGQLYWFAAKVNGGETDIDGKLMEDIVVNPGSFADDGTYTPKNGETVRVWTPIGYWESDNDYVYYTGSFDGGEHTISGLYFNDSTVRHVGLFGGVGEGGKVQNVGVVNSYFCGYSNVGGVVGDNGGAVTNCYNAGTVTGGMDVGGVAGYNKGTVTNCYNTGDISGDYAGGMAGFNDGTVTNCYNTGDISGDYAGGVAGEGTVTNCYYLDTCGAAGEGTAKTAEQFKSGEVAYLLNGSTSEGVWKQTLGTDAAPSFTGGTVYSVKNCKDAPDYSNTNETLGHKWVNGTCSVCGEPCDHTGGTATCTTLAVCDICGESYGELAAHDIQNNVCTKCGFTYYNLWVGGVQVNSDNAENVLGDGKVSYDAQTQTLTLSDADIRTADLSEKVPALKVQDGSITLVLTGENKLTGAENCPGILIESGASVTVAQDSAGSLDVQGQALGYLEQEKIYVNSSVAGDGDLTVAGGTVTGGIHMGGTITITGGTVNADFLAAENVVISGGTVTAAGQAKITYNDATAPNGTYGIYADKDIQISGGSVTVSGGYANITESYNPAIISKASATAAMYAGNAVTVTGGTVTATGGEWNGYYPSDLGFMEYGGGYTEAGADNVKNVIDKYGKALKAPSFTISDEASFTCGDGTAEHYSHSFAGATCSSSAVCAFCGTEDGKVDKNNHDETVAYENGFCPYCDAFEPAKLVDGVYQIGNAGQLYWFADKVTNENAAYGSANAILTADITVNENVLAADGTANAGTFRVWTPIGKVGWIDNNRVYHPYTGTFDGQGNTVSGLYYHDTTTMLNAGLFSVVGEGGIVKNVGVADSYICGNDPVGAVASSNYGTVTGCYHTGTVISSGTAGGVVGGNSGTVTNCYNTGTVSGTDDVGGVVGNNIVSSGGVYYSPIVTDCYNSGTVSGSDTVGGVVGNSKGDSIHKGIVTGCYNTGTVSGTDDVGGVVGFGNASNCYNTGTVSGTDYVGGVVGSLMGGASVMGCYSSGTVNGTNYVGGVAGDNSATVTNCYFDSTVYTGNAFGTNSGTATDVEGKSTEQFKSGEVAYLLSQGENGSIWGQTIGTDPAPVFSDAKVYYGYTSCGDTAAVYTNNANVFPEKPEHTQNPTYTDNHDGTHSAAYPCCGTTVTEGHTMDTATGKCVCGEIIVVKVTRDGAVSYYTNIKDVTAGEKGSGAVLTVLRNITLTESKNLGYMTLEREGDATITVPDGCYLNVNSNSAVTWIDCVGYRAVQKTGGLEISYRTFEKVNGNPYFLLKDHTVTNTSVKSGYLNITEGATLTVTGTMDVSADRGQILVYGKLVLGGNAAATNAGEIRVNGTLELGANAAITNSGTILLNNPDAYKTGHDIPAGITGGTVEIDDVTYTYVSGGSTDEKDTLPHWTCSDHTGLIGATCITKAHCVNCGDEYEKYGDHSINTTTGECVHCGEYIAVATVSDGTTTLYASGEQQLKELTEQLLNSGSRTITAIISEGYMLDSVCTAVRNAVPDENQTVHLTVEGVTAISGDSGLRGLTQLASLSLPDVTYLERNALRDIYLERLELTAEGAITLERDVIDQGYVSDLVLCCNKASAVTDGVTWNNYTFKSITFKHDYVDGVCRICSEACDHSGNTNKTYTKDDDDTHSLQCSVCGMAAETGEHDGSRAATCEAQAKCGTCGTEYGELLDHVMDPATGLCTSGCGKMMAEASITKGGSITYYETLNEAIQAVSSCTAGDKAEVKLLSSLTLTETIAISSGVFTLDLNEKDVTFSKTANIGFEISGGEVTFAGNGTVTMEVGTAIFAKEDAVVTISGGTYDGAVALANDGTATVSGGALKGSGFGIRNMGDLTISGGEVSPYQKNTDNPYNVTAIISSEGRITVTGGTLKAGRFGMLMYQDGTIDLSGFGGAEGVTIWRDDLSTVEMNASDVMLADGFGLFDEKGTQQTGSIAEGTMLTVKQLHVHDWTYTADGNTITATCNAEGCPDAEQSFTLNAPDVGYSGNPVEAEVTRDGTDLTYTLRYTGTNYDSADAPTNAGDYTVTMTVGDKSVSDTFTISPKNISKVASCQFSLTQTSFVYSGKTPVLNVTGVDSSVGSYTMQEGTDYSLGTVQVNAGSHKLTVTGIGNYTGIVELDYTITAKEVSIIGAAIQSVTYDPDGYTLTVTGVTFDGVVDGETLAYNAEAILGNTNAFGEQDATVTVTLDNSNYNLVTATYQTKVTINKAVATVTAAPTPNDLTYTGEAQYLINAGEANGGTMQYSTDNQTWSTTIPKGTAAGEYTVYYKVVGDENHSDTAVDSVEVTIAKADPVIGTVGCKMPLFDSTDISTVELTRTDMSVDGTLILTDSELTAGEGTYNWKFTPEDTDNYNTITGTVVLNVTADELERIRAIGTLKKFSYVYGELFSIDGMTVTAIYTSGATKDVTGLVSFDSTLAVGQTAVELTYGGKTCIIDDITVAKKQLIIDRMAWAVPEDAVYNGTEFTATLNGTLPTGVVAILSGDKATNAGDYTAKAVFSLAEGYSADNYEIVNGEDLTADWTIAKKNIAGAQITLGTALTYNGKQQTQTVASVKIDGLAVTYTVSGNTGTDAKGYTLTVTGNGNFEGTENKEWSIAKKNISDAAITLGDSLTYNGNERTQEVTDVKIGDLTVTYDVTTNKQTNAGSYTLTVTGNGNFEGSATADWSIAKAKLTITANNNSITYGDVPAANGATGTGFVSSESMEDLSGELACSYNYEQFGNVGTYKITPSGVTSNNYEITFADGTLTVNAKAITVTADAVSKIYGEADPALTYKVEGLVNGDELTGELKRAAGENVGSYAIEQNTLTAGNNYSITYTGANLTINAKAITEADVELNGSLTYTGKEQTQPITVTEGITYEVTGNKATNVGSYVLTVKGTGNYTGEVKLNWSIKETAAVVTKAPAAKTLTYTGEAQELITAGEAEGGTMQYQLNNGAWSASIPTAKDEGTYTVSWKVVGDANHADTEVRSITVTIGDCTHSGNTNKDDADCTTQVTCSVCGDVLVAAKTHVWGDWTTTKNPTTTEEGSKERLCTNDGCEAKDTDSIPMLNEVEVPEEIVGGDVSVDNPTPATGEDVTITVTPDTGKEVVDVVVKDEDDNEIPVTKNEDGTYTYEQPDGDVTVEVIIKDTIYTVTWIVDGKTYKETQLKYGETITAPTDPTKAQSGCTTYTFAKWNGFTSGMTMPDDPSLTFTAVFTEGESHIDENTDHICDRNCGKTDMGDHVDENLDHVCDYGCDKVYGEHKDTAGDGDHVCDHGCGETLTDCADVDTDTDHKCDECGAAMPKDGTQVEIPADDTGTITPGAPAEIDGKPIVIDWDGEIWLEDKGSKLLVTYKFNEDADPHKAYPTAMYAWLLKWEGETCKAIRIPELDNFMNYKGTSIRINHSSDGIRFFTAVPIDTLNQAMKGTLLTGELEGYKLAELGTLYKWAATGTELTVANGAKSYVYGGSAGSNYRQFSKEGSLSWFTGMLTELPGDAATLAKDILSRPYAVFENADGDQITLYGGSIQRSIYYVAQQNKDTWASGTAYDNYVEKIISTVEAAKG